MRTINYSIQCPLLGVKRTSVTDAAMSAFDPKRTSKARHETGPGSKLEAGMTLRGRPKESASQQQSATKHFPITLVTWCGEPRCVNLLPATGGVSDRPLTHIKVARLSPSSLQSRIAPKVHLLFDVVEPRTKNKKGRSHGPNTDQRCHNHGGRGCRQHRVDSLKHGRGLGQACDGYDEAYWLGPFHDHRKRGAAPMHAVPA